MNFLSVNENESPGVVYTNTVVQPADSSDLLLLVERLKQRKHFIARCLWFIAVFMHLFARGSPLKMKCLLNFQ